MSSVVDWVLLVDDDEIQNFIHQRIIRKYVLESQIIIATNGQEGLKILQANKKINQIYSAVLFF